MNKWKAAAAACLLALTLCGCSNSQTAKSEICESKPYPGNGYLIDYEGDQLTSITYMYEMDEATIEASLTDGITKDDAFNYYVDYFQKEFDNVAGNNRDLPYFQAKVSSNKDSYTVSSSYSFKLDNEEVLKAAEDPDSNLYKLMDYFGIPQFYDKENKTFSVTKLKESEQFNDVQQISCRDYEEQ